MGAYELVARAAALADTRRGYVVAGVDQHAGGVHWVQEVTGLAAQASSIFVVD